MVTMTPAIRPIRFSALKTLDPLDEEEKRGENHDGQPDIDEVEHGALQGFLLVCATWPATRSGARVAGGPRMQALPRWRSGLLAAADGIQSSLRKRSKVRSMRDPCAAHAVPNRTHAPGGQRMRNRPPGGRAAGQPLVLRW